MMVGIDRDVLAAQEIVLTDARQLHQAALDAAVAIEARAMSTEQRAHDEALSSTATERAAHDQVIRARVMQAEQRHAIRECTADIAEIREVLATIPTPRPAAG